MKTVTKPKDQKAASIGFGVEIETMIPASCGISVGGYHSGNPVIEAVATNGEVIESPKFNGACWMSERDSSIVAEPDYIPCEFVSPILRGDGGLAALRRFIQFASRIGAKVNKSCGCHITVSIADTLGNTRPENVSEFIRKLAHIANHNAWAIFAQTGTDRHLNHYAAPLSSEVERMMSELVHPSRRSTTLTRDTLTRQCGRGMVNFQKAFTSHCIEFRAFAGTLNESKVMHHLATALGLMRRAATAETVGRFGKSEKKCKAKTGVEALRRMWRILGWTDSVPNRDCALGLFGNLHAEFFKYRKTALEMAEKFDERYPNPNL